MVGRKANHTERTEQPSAKTSSLQRDAEERAGTAAALPRCQKEQEVSPGDSPKF